jgi:Tol biopolymer transport system component
MQLALAPRLAGGLQYTRTQAISPLEPTSALETLMIRPTARRLFHVMLAALLAAPAMPAQSTRRVWSGPEFDQLGSPSPDGRSMTFVDWTSGDLALKDLRADVTRHLTARGTFKEPGGFRGNLQEFALFSLFSPDGQKVAFTWYVIDIAGTTREGVVPARLELRVVDTSASESRVLTSVAGERAYIQPVDWARDGQSILTTGQGEDGTGRIMIIPLSGSPRIIKSFPDWRAPVTVKLSPDGKYVAYDYQPKKTEGRRNIYLLPLQGGSETAVVDDVADGQLVGWVADGSHLLFTSARSGTPGLWALPVSGGRRQGAPRLLKQDMWRSSPVALTPDGKYYYTVQGGDQDIYIATYDASGKLQSRPLGITGRTGGQYHQNPRWSPDGKYLAFVTTGIGNNLVGGTTLTIYSVETGEKRQFRPPVTYLQAAYWLPGSRALALRARDDQGRPALLKLDLGTSEISTIILSTSAEAGLQPAFSPDGKWLYMSPAVTTPKAPRRIVAHDLKSGEEHDLYVSGPLPARAGPGGSPMFVSPDGRWLAMAMHTDTVDQRRVVVIPTAGGPARILAGKAPDAQPVSRVAGFSGDSKSVIYSSATNASGKTQSSLWRLPIDGGASQRVEVPAKDFRFPATSPDGRRVAYGAGELAAELWVLDDVAARLRGASNGTRRR